MTRSAAEPVGMLLRLETRTSTNLLRWKSARKAFMMKLHEAKKRCRMPVLNYLVLPQAVSILTVPDSVEHVGRFVGCLRGSISSSHARKTGQEGPFWKNRGQYTLVQGTVALRHCLEVMAWEPVRQGCVLHPCQYPWSGYAELVGIRQRYRVGDYARLAVIYGGATESKLHAAIAEGVEAKKDGGQVLAEWEDAFAVGKCAWIEMAAETLRPQRRNTTRFGSGEDGLYALTTANRHRRIYMRKLIQRLARLNSKKLS
ncbi:MAG: hypothetical protein ACOYOU_18285 [Kiritimatiellia bacterium]|jgi:putative transposase